MTCAQQNSAPPSPPHQGPVWPWYGMLAVFAVLSVGLLVHLVYGGHALQQAMLRPGRGLMLGANFWVMGGLGIIGWGSSGLWVLAVHVGASRQETRYLVGAGACGLALVDALFLMAHVTLSLEGAEPGLGAWLGVALCASAIVGLGGGLCWCCMRLEQAGDQED